MKRVQLNPWGQRDGEKERETQFLGIQETHPYQSILVEKVGFLVARMVKNLPAGRETWV